MDKSEALIQILKLPVRKRSHDDISLIATLLDSIKFFKDNKLSLNDLYHVAQNMTYDLVETDNNVIEYNTYGDKFYIIIKGNVSVLIPIKITNQDGSIQTIFKDVATLGSGKSFGELALITNAKR